MKTFIFTVLITGTLLSVNCRKQHEPFFKFPGEIEITKNGEPWEANIYAYPRLKDATKLEILIARGTNDCKICTEELVIFNVPIQTGHYYVNGHVTATNVSGGT